MSMVLLLVGRWSVVLGGRAWLLLVFGLGCWCRTMFGLSESAARAEAFLRRPLRRAWCVPATTRRVQAVSRPRHEWGHAVRRTRVESCPSCSRGLGQTTDLAVAEAVIDERENFAGDRDGGFVFAAAFRDLSPIGGEFGSAVVSTVLRSPPIAQAAIPVW